MLSFPSLPFNHHHNHNLLQHPPPPPLPPVSTAISGILAELDQFSSELETRQQQKKEELSRLMMMEREKRNNECKHETLQKRDRVSANDTVPMHVPSSSPKFQRKTEPEMTLYSNRTSNFDNRSDLYQTKSCRKVSSDTNPGVSNLTEDRFCKYSD